MSFVVVGVSLSTLLSTCGVFWEPVRDSLLPAVVALLNVTVLWVAFRVRGISKDVRSTSQEVEATLVVAHQLLGRNVSPPDAPAPRKS